MLVKHAIAHPFARLLLLRFCHPQPLDERRPPNPINVRRGFLPSPLLLGKWRPPCLGSLRNRAATGRERRLSWVRLRGCSTSARRRRSWIGRRCSLGGPFVGIDNRNR